jgi:ribonuclease Z
MKTPEQSYARRRREVLMLRVLAFGLFCFVLLLPGAESHAQNAFKVTLLGTASPSPRPTRMGPSTLVEAGSQRLLFDAGRGVPVRLWQIKVPMGTIDALFITHYHSDHVSGIPDLWLTGWLSPPFGRRKMPFHVIGPTGAKSLMENIDKAFALDKSIRIEDEKLPPEGVAIEVDEFSKDGLVYEKDGVKVIAFEVDHGAAIKPAYGYRIEYNGHAVTISGDTRYNENVIKYGTGADVLIHEVGMARPELMSNVFVQRIIDHHTTPKDVGRVFAQARPKLGVYTHIVMLSSEKIPEPTIDDLVAETRLTYSGPLEVGDDLTSFDIGDTVTVKKFKP